MALAQQGIFKKGDMFIFCFVLVLAIALFAVSFLKNTDTPYEAVITVNGIEIASYELAEIKTPKTIEIDNEFGKNTVVIEKDGVTVTESNCPDMLEVKQGKITKTGQSLVCLPHRLLIELCGKSDIAAISR